MKTKYIPALVMLLAGLVNCLYTMLSGMSLLDFTKRLLIVLIIFYIIGVVVKIVIDMNFKDLDDDNQKKQSEENEAGKLDDIENINTDEKIESSEE